MAGPWTGVDEALIDDLLARMTLAEKVGQCVQPANLDPVADHDRIAAGAVGSALYASGPLGGAERDAGMDASPVEACQRIARTQSRLGIPLVFGRDVIHGHRTVCPIPLGLAATWDEDLVGAVCELAAAEAVEDGVGWTFAPMVDISEDPRWGRVAEGFGEAPALSGRLAAAAVEGFQRHVAATAKHFVGYGLASGGRDYDTVQVGENTLRNLHLRPFRAAVDAGVAAVMAAFNDVDGVPMHAHRRLIREVLKREWGFDGVVVSDWAGVAQLVDHGVAADLRDAARQAMLAGVDVDMASDAYADHLAGLVEDGDVPLDLLDDAVRRVLRLKARLGLLDPAQPRTRGPVAVPAGGRDLARRAAVASTVLLSNDGTLPLPDELGSLHLTGPFVEDGEALLGTWVLDGRGEDVVTPATALRARLGDRLTVTDGRFSDLAAVRTRAADVTVALLGEHPARSGEARSVADIGLPAGQLEVLHQLAGLGKPVVAVVYTGRPLDLTAVLDRAAAVLVAWHPGVEAGPALADVLFGVREPGGRLPMTFPRSVGHIPSSHHSRPTSRVIDPADDRRTGRYLDALTNPVLPFGFGLTYTAFEHLGATLSSTVLRPGHPVTLEVTIRNRGLRPGSEVVQLYFRDPVADVTRPRVELLDWARVELDAGAETRVRFELDRDRFAYFGRDQARRVDDGVIELMVGPNAATISQQRQIEVRNA